MPISSPGTAWPPPPAPEGGVIGAVIAFWTAVTRLSGGVGGAAYLDSWLTIAIMCAVHGTTRRGSTSFRT